MSVIIATLIMVAAAVLFTSIMLYWGLSFQGQSLTNYGNAIDRSNNAAAEQTSIDNVLFRTVTTSPTVTYTATVYARNFGDNPLKIAGVHIASQQSGASPPGFDCEVNTGAPAGHLTIVARSAGAIPLDTGCKSAITFPVCYDGATISIAISTEGGTKFQNNYVVPSASVSILSQLPTPSNTAPSFSITIGNVGCISQTISSVTITGSSTNGANHFTGSVTATIPTSGTFTPTASDPSTWTASPNTASTFQSITSSSQVTLVLSTTGAGSATKLVAGDSFTVQIITSTGLVISAQYTA